MTHFLFRFYELIVASIPLFIVLGCKLKRRDFPFLPTFLVTWFLLIPYGKLADWLAPEIPGRSFDFGALVQGYVFISLLILPVFSGLNIYYGKFGRLSSRYRYFYVVTGCVGAFIFALMTSKIVLPMIY